MEEKTKIVSKVLICEDDLTICDQIKLFCSNNNILTLRAQHDTIINVLKTNIDLSGIFLYEDLHEKRYGIELGVDIHKTRPELPIFLRSDRIQRVDDLPESARNTFAGVYNLNDTSNLESLIDIYLFSTHYPDPMVRKVMEISYDAFANQFRGVSINCDLPYLVKDKMIYGELFSLMPLESDWCRGYMMMQTEKDSITRMIDGGKTIMGNESKEVNFRDVNGVISELTNLIWGGIKNNFFHNLPDVAVQRTQVPIIVNHGEKYISFGSQEPQLCFRYRIEDEDGKIEPLTLYQKFIFHLNWSPDQFPECQQAEDDLVESGELELF